MEFPLGLITLLRSANHVAVLTGAGVSQESGLYTFRDTQVGLWSKYRPEDLATPEAFARDPKLVWDWYAMRRARVVDAQPNPGHFALAEMSRRVPYFSLITQNVDGLHQRAGNQDVLELHGSIIKVRCSECESFASTWIDDGVNVPRCAVCGGFLRPHVVWFGESLPQAVLMAAVEATRTCDLFFSIGTSGLVQPAASLAHVAKNHGAVIVEVNAEETPLSPHADYFLKGKSGEILPELTRAVWG